MTAECTLHADYFSNTPNGLLWCTNRKKLARMIKGPEISKQSQALQSPWNESLSSDNQEAEQLQRTFEREPLE